MDSNELQKFRENERRIKLDDKRKKDIERTVTNHKVDEILSSKKEQDE